MRIAIVILNWNGKELLKSYLPSVVQYSEGAEIYVADNASTDDSVAFLKEHYPAVKIILNSVNGGYSKGYNDALSHVDADIFCLLNSDVEVSENWLSEIIKTFEKLPNAAIIQPKILDLKRKTYFEYAGAGGGFIDQLGYPFCRGRIFQALEEDKGQYNDTREIFWATGACMFIKRDVFNEVKGLDEDYFAHQEEVDLCWRAKNKGHQVYYVGTSHVYHLGGSTLSNMNPRKTFLNFRNSLFSITKNLPRRKAFVIIFIRLILDAATASSIFIRLILDAVAALRFIFQLKFKHCFAILKAHLSFYRHFRKMYRKREKANFILKYHVTKSIVWSHFVHQESVFSALIKD